MHKVAEPSQPCLTASIITTALLLQRPTTLPADARADVFRGERRRALSRRSRNLSSPTASPTPLVPSSLANSVGCPKWFVTSAFILFRWRVLLTSCGIFRNASSRPRLFGTRRCPLT
jgi:hypothetical protein